MAEHMLNLGHDHTPVVWSTCVYHLIFNPRGLKVGQKLHLLINGHTLTFTKEGEDDITMKYWDPFQTTKPWPGRKVKLGRDPIMLGRIFTYFDRNQITGEWDTTIIPHPVTAIGLSK